MPLGLVGKKIGMTREFFDVGISVPVTVIHVEKGRIIDVIKKEQRGYDAVKIGFGKVNKTKMLTPYFTTKKNGTGLGLAIVTKIINDHNGSISFKSVKEGAEVEIILPK